MFVCFVFVLLPDKETCSNVAPSQELESIWNHVHRFLQTVSFSLADPAVCPFTIINLSDCCNYLLRPVSLSSKYPNMGMVLETLTIPHYKLQDHSVTYGYYQEI